MTATEEIKKCPVCGGSGDCDERGYSCADSKKIACPASEIYFTESEWNTRPLEDAARREQMEEDCAAVCADCRDGYPEAEDSHDLACAPIRRAFAEREGEGGGK